jgi:hypothetical protein
MMGALVWVRWVQDFTTGVGGTVWDVYAVVVNVILLGCLDASLIVVFAVMCSEHLRSIEEKKTQTQMSYQLPLDVDGER